ncbi:MAG: cell division protein ZipA, partial [Salinisphaera sp.]|uniref:cell division protein ZipA n=1 Tax=Salinisphaera sp. TaxID=1914330 RepID=UPI003C7B392C
QTTVRSSEAEPPRGLDKAAAGYDDSPAADTEIPPAVTERVDMVAPERTEQSQLFMLYVAAPEGQVFDGPTIHETLAKADLKFGLNDLYHRVTEVHGVTESVFCVANMLKPGTLDPVDQDQLTTPGLTMFLLVPAPIEGRPAMRDMMETANLLATELGGNVLDDNRALLKAQTAQYILDQIADIDRRAQLGRRR